MQKHINKIITGNCVEVIILLYMNLKPVRRSEFISESPKPQALC